ncbi:hypothetical protein N0V83_009914 [Neocucurbitaria cava]|uniref:Uncharacterized protein n=1 Tax=Neocucurbitaria cava TaxID=798079 RepID=A0A9W8XZA4_9PLEO|nr:hypothetical protein N0V83_009914 [Neocucurbitaria cava]
MDKLRSLLSLILHSTPLTTGMGSVYVIIMSWSENPMKPPFKLNAKSFDDAQQLLRNCTNTKLYDAQKDVNRPPDSSLGWDSILEFNEQREDEGHVHNWGWYKHREQAEDVIEALIEVTKHRRTVVRFSTTHYHKTEKVYMCSYGVNEGYQGVGDAVLEQHEGMEMMTRRMITKTVYYWWQIEKVEMPLLKVDEDVAKAGGHREEDDGDTDDEEFEEDEDTDDEEFAEAMGLRPG